MVKTGPITVAFWFEIPEALPIEDTTTEAGKLFKHAVDVTAKQSGYPVYWGRIVENPDKVLVLVVFESLDARIESRAADWRKNAIKEIMSLSTRYPDVCHIEFNDDILPALESPICAFAAACFDPGDEKAEVRDKFESTFQGYEARFEQRDGSKPYLTSIFTGWALEDDVPYAAWYDGSMRRGKGFFMISGWESPEKMYEFHTSDMARDESRDLLDMVDGWVIQNVKFIRSEGNPSVE